METRPKWPCWGSLPHYGLQRAKGARAPRSQARTARPHAGGPKAKNPGPEGRNPWTLLLTTANRQPITDPVSHLPFRWFARKMAGIGGHYGFRAGPSESTRGLFQQWPAQRGSFRRRRRNGPTPQATRTKGMECEMRRCAPVWRWYNRMRTLRTTSREKQMSHSRR